MQGLRRDPGQRLQGLYRKLAPISLQTQRLDPLAETLHQMPEPQAQRIARAFVQFQGAFGSGNGGLCGWTAMDPRRAARAELFDSGAVTA